MFGEGWEVSEMTGHGEEPRVHALCGWFLMVLLGTTAAGCASSGVAAFLAARLPARGLPDAGNGRLRLLVFIRQSIIYEAV